MIIRFVQSGGVTGLVREYTVDTANLAPDEAEKVEQLVRNGGLSASGVHFSQTGRDMLQYDIILEDDGRRIEATCDDGTLPARAKPLVAYLKKQARPARPPS